jgi:molybdate transport system regulatory protein
VSFEVNLRLDAEHELSAMISRESAENLGLSIGREVHALVNASAVILTTDATIRTTARNRLWGEVSKICDGPVNSDVTITLPGGRTVNALVTRDSVANLGLAVGKMACALFKASSVILATFD